MPWPQNYHCGCHTPCLDKHDQRFSIQYFLAKCIRPKLNSAVLYYGVCRVVQSNNKLSLTLHSLIQPHRAPGGHPGNHHVNFSMFSRKRCGIYKRMNFIQSKSFLETFSSLHKNTIILLICISRSFTINREQEEICNAHTSYLFLLKNFIALARNCKL